MIGRDMPAAEVAVDAALVRALLGDQHPDLAPFEVREVANGWDNVVFRLGDAFSVRMPRRLLGAQLIENEQRWLPGLAPSLPLPIPTPERVGVPGHGYPWRWSVCRWLPGEVAARVPPDDWAHAAQQLGAFLAALHRPAPPDAPANPYRGVPLADRDDVTRERIAVLGNAIDRDRVLALWGQAVAASCWSDAPVWIHGDPHPANVLVHQGRISAVIDFGDITGGDPATDLALAWTLLPVDTRTVFRRAAGTVDDATWMRARGWALAHGLACLATSADNPLMLAIGRRTIDAVLADDAA
jgi:aminoglycoside phosphotransferase (APT) family kinase protein